MRILGIDFGESRIGLSKSDPLGFIASGLDTINWKNNNEVPFDKLIELIRNEKIEVIVVGFPSNMNGTVGPRGERTQWFINELRMCLDNNNIEVQIIKWDERLSTKAAYRTMHELGVKTKKKKSLVDKLASVHILQSYLDFKQNRK